MADTWKVESERRAVEGPADQYTIRNLGPDTLYYGGPSVSSSDTQLAAGAQVTVAPTTWLISAGQSRVTVAAVPVSPSSGSSAVVGNVWAIGDSLTIGAAPGGGGITFDPAIYADTGQGGLQYQGGSWVPHALMASGARWTVRGVYGTGGYTAAQILSTHVPSVLARAARGDTVVVCAGMNGTVIADAIAIHETLRAAGLNTVAVTLPPNTAGTLASTYAFNSALLSYAASKGIPIAAVHQAVVDPATGLWLPAYNGDGTHGNKPGTQAFGQAVAAALNQVFPYVRPLVSHNAAMAGQLQTKPLALGAPTNGPDYANLAALGTSTIAAAAMAGAQGGNGYVFTRGDTDINARMANVTLTQGHRYRVGMAIAATVVAGSWGLRLESNSTGTKIVWGMGYPASLGVSQPFGRFFSDFDVPTLPDYGYRLRVSAAGVGTVLSLGEVTLEDLTVTGG